MAHQMEEPRTVTLSREDAKGSWGIMVTPQCQVMNVIPGSPAHRARIPLDAVIEAINGQPVNRHGLVVRILKDQVQNSITVSFRPPSAQHSSLSEPLYDSAPIIAPTAPMKHEPSVRTVNLVIVPLPDSKGLGVRLRGNEAERVTDGSAAAMAGVRKGMRIVAINEEAIPTDVQQQPDWFRQRMSGVTAPLKLRVQVPESFVDDRTVPSEMVPPREQTQPPPDQPSSDLPSAHPAPPARVIPMPAMDPPRGIPKEVWDLIFQFAADPARDKIVLSPELESRQRAIIYHAIATFFPNKRLLTTSVSSQGLPKQIMITKPENRSIVEPDLNAVWRQEEQGENERVAFPTRPTEADISLPRTQHFSGRSNGNATRYMPARSQHIENVPNQNPLLGAADFEPREIPPSTRPSDLPLHQQFDHKGRPMMPQLVPTLSGPVPPNATAFHFGGSPTTLLPLSMQPPPAGVHYHSPSIGDLDFSQGGAFKPSAQQRPPLLRMSPAALIGMNDVQETGTDGENSLRDVLLEATYTTAGSFGAGTVEQLLEDLRAAGILMPRHFIGFGTQHLLERVPKLSRAVARQITPYLDEMPTSDFGVATSPLERRTSALPLCHLSYCERQCWWLTVPNGAPVAAVLDTSCASSPKIFMTARSACRYVVQASQVESTNSFSSATLFVQGGYNSIFTGTNGFHITSPLHFCPDQNVAWMDVALQGPHAKFPLSPRVGAYLTSLDEVAKSAPFCDTIESLLEAVGSSEEAMMPVFRGGSLFDFATNDIRLPLTSYPLRLEGAIGQPKKWCKFNLHSLSFVRAAMMAAA